MSRVRWPVKQAATVWGTTPKTIRQWIAIGRIPSDDVEVVHELRGPVYYILESERPPLQTASFEPIPYVPKPHVGRGDVGGDEDVDEEDSEEPTDADLDEIEDKDL